MSSPSIGRGPDLVVIDRLASMLGSHFDEEQRVVPLGSRNIGGNQSVIRFRASRATLWVTAHVQSSTAGSVYGLIARGFPALGTEGLYARGLGIGSAGLVYDADGAVASERVDCRQDRQQDLTISRDGVNRYVVWLVPEFLETDGTYTKFDGEDAADQMAFIDLGI